MTESIKHKIFYSKFILIIFFLFLNLDIVAQSSVYKAFYSKGKIKSEISYVDEVLEGTSRWYYENGNVKEEKTYSNGKLNGLVREFYENGLIKYESNVTNGILNGVTKTFYPNGALSQVKEYDFGKLTKSIEIAYDSNYIAPIEAYKAGNRIWKIEEGEFLCDLDICPQPLGGLIEIERNINYPKLAKQYGLEGEVFVSAIVSELGIAEKVTIIRGLGLGCDEAAVEAVKKTKFIPGEKNGIPKKANVSFKVKFNLENNNKLNFHNINKEEINKSVITSDDSSFARLNDKKYFECNSEICPEPLGGISEMLKKLKYPPHALRNKITGEVEIKAKVNDLGFVVAAEVVKGIGYGCNEAAKSLVIKTQFKPAKNNGVDSESVLNITIPFIIKE